jgi:hypothetical protein
LCIALIFLDSKFLPDIVWQTGARNFPSTSGVVLESRVKDTSDSDGNSYRADISYRYTAAGREWISSRITCGEITNRSRSAAERMAAALSPGTTVTVFYDPAEPGKAVLRAGLQPAHLSSALFLTTFHVVPFVFIAPTLGVWTRRNRSGAGLPP